MKDFRKFPILLFVATAIFFVLFLASSNIVWAASKVNINTANITELDTIPEIGPATAQKIIDYRVANGPFAVIEDIMKVSGIKEATFAKIKDYITVDTSSGSDEDTGDENDETSTTTATTTTATSTSSTTPTTTSGGSSYSVHYIQEDLSDYEPTNVFEVSAGRDRLAYIDLPINFKAKHKVSKDLENKSCNYLWTFGDGSSLSGEKVEHIYKYAGDYNAVLNGKCNGLLSVSRTSVKVVKPDLLIAQKADGAVEVLNQGEYEINLYGWKLKTENQEYVFPQDTIISAGKTVTFPAEYLKISIMGNNVILVDSSGKSIAQTSFRRLVSDMNNFSAEISVADFEKFALEYKRLVQADRRVLSAVAVTAPNNLNILPAKIVGFDREAVNNVPLTASVFSAIISTTSPADLADNSGNEALAEVTTRGFWGKLFHPIQTIKESFYK